MKPNLSSLLLCTQTVSVSLAILAIAPSLALAESQPASTTTSSVAYPTGTSLPASYYPAPALPISYPATVPAPVVYPAGVAYPAYPTATPQSTTTNPSLQVVTTVNIPQQPGYQPGAQMVYPIGVPAQFGYPGATVPYPAGVPVYPSVHPSIAYPSYPGQPVYPATIPPYPLPQSVSTPSTLVQGGVNQEWLQKLVEADRLYRIGQFAQAEKLFREAMAPLASTSSLTNQTTGITDPALLPADAQVYWQQAIAAQGQRFDAQTLSTLETLVRSYPQFIPAQVQLIRLLDGNGRTAEAMARLERAIGLYPNQPELVRLQVALLQKANQWTEAAIAARRFALLNPSNTAAAEFTRLADESLKRAQTSQQRQFRTNLVGGVLRGTLGYLLTDKTSTNRSSLPLSILQGVLQARQQSTPSTSPASSDMQQMLDLLFSTRR